MPIFGGDPRQDDATRRGRLYVRVRKPGVEREDRHLDGKPRKSPQKTSASQIGSPA